MMQSDHTGRDTYIFLDRLKNSGSHFCRSFFPRDDKNFTAGQTKCTLLYKKKINKISGKFEIQYNRLFDK